MNQAKIEKLEKKIQEIMSRPGYATALADQQEVAELQVQIEELRTGRAVERASYQRPAVAVAEAGGAAAAALPAGVILDYDPEAPEEDHGSHGVADYLRILGALSVLTALELAWVPLTAGIMGGMLLWGGLTAMALVKATLVAMFYMHLKFESRIMYAILAIPCVLVAVMMFLVLPDTLQYLW